MIERNSQSEVAWKWFERVSKVLTIFIIPILLWAIRVELVVRALPKDANTLQMSVERYVDNKISDLPPQLFRENVAKIEDLAKENNERIRQVELSVARIETNVNTIRHILDNG